MGRKPHFIEASNSARVQQRCELLYDSKNKQKKTQKNTEKKENIYVYIYCGIRNELGHTTRRIRDNVLCAVVRACVPAVLHSLQFFLLLRLLLLSKISGITLCMCTSHIVAVAVSVSDKSFVCLLFANICSFCLELQIACKTSAVHSLLAFNLQAANRKVTHTHILTYCLCVCELVFHFA